MPFPALFHEILKLPQAACLPIKKKGKPQLACPFSSVNEMALAFFFGSFGFGNDLCLEVGGYTAVS